MYAAPGDGTPDFAGRCAQHDRRALDLDQANIRFRLIPEGQRRAGQVPSKADRVHERTAPYKALRDRHLLPPDGFQGGEILDVRRMDVEQDGHVGRYQPRERRNLAGMIGADLVYRGARVLRSAGQGERHTKVVVEASRCGEGIDDRGRERLERGLAAASRHRHHRTIQAPPGRAAKIPEGIQAVFDENGGNSVVAPAVNQHGDGTPGNRIRREIVSVPVRAGARCEPRSRVAG